MNIFTDTSKIDKYKKTVITIGTFDGIHKGHLNLLKTVVKRAKETNSRSFVITFDPHPRLIISPEAEIKILTTLNEKLQIFEETGIENVMVVNFNKEFSQMSYEEFISKFICDKIGVNHIVIGYDHRFGKNRDGNEIKLRKLGEVCGFEVATVASVKNGGEIVSSTKIRRALLEGRIEKANNLLAKKYSLTGIVIQGAQRGKLLGFPTANIKLEDENKLVPKRGVYVVSCRLESGYYYGIMNIGVRPTFEKSDEVIKEVHILNFSKKIYGKKIQVEFLRRLRDEKKYDSKEALVSQIKEDLQNSLKIINTLVN